MRNVSEEPMKGMNLIFSAGAVMVVSVTLLIYGVAPGQEKTPSAVEKRAADVVGLFRENPGGYEQLFSKSFLAQVPPERLTAIFSYYYSICGRCVQLQPVDLSSQLTGKFSFIFEKKVSVPANFTVEAAAPNLISGLFLGNPVSLSTSLDQVIGEFKGLPGVSALLAVKLAGDKLETVAGYNADRHLAIGSTFKLYILSELLRCVNEGERTWKDVVTLSPDAVSLPTGVLQSWPAGSPLTLHTLATLMISQSDNTATDQLLRLLGREKVEKMLSAAGHSRPELDIPFLSTMEVFKLKSEQNLSAAHSYLSLPAAKRHTFLADSLMRIGRESLSFRGQPTLVDSIEWFASAADLCRVMNWIRLNSESGPGAEVRQILAVNPGLAIPKDKWKYAGYKGGSEAGVMNMTYLLQSTDGGWYALSATWNNTQAPLDDAKLVGLVGGVLQLVK
jgi:beta-lactamase class A